MLTDNQRLGKDSATKLLVFSWVRSGEDDQIRFDQRNDPFSTANGCSFHDLPHEVLTLLETNGSPLKIGLLNRKVVFQPSIFRCELLVSGSVNKFKTWTFLTTKTNMDVSLYHFCQISLAKCLNRNGAVWSYHRPNH